jgi:hypothetical protein
MYSQAGQDAFVIEITQEKRQGKFLEFGAGHPMEGSNTFLLERSFNWSGTCIDDGQTWQNLPALWKEHRPQSKKIGMLTLKQSLKRKLTNINVLPKLLQLNFGNR